MRWQFAWILFVGCQSLTAVQYIPIDPTAVIEVQVSSSNHNRISIVGDRIKKAYFKSSDIAVDVEEATGQIFVQACRPHCPSSTLSIVSTSGLVQDLELHFVDSSSEIILLQPDSEMQEPCGPLALEGEGISDLVQCIIQGQVPQGYVSIEDIEDPTTLYCGLTQQRLGRLVSDKQIVFIYRLENTSKKIKTLKECKVNILDGDWVFLDRYRLSPGEGALALIGCLR